ncbi:Transposon Ty3-G Gag-Pol polyprotein, partial [Choanephora cucurbitarum]
IRNHFLCVICVCIYVPNTTPDSAEGYKSQYPIADKLKPKVQETVEKWLSERIIKEVPSNVDNRWNSPLTLAPKKVAQGNYTDKRPCLDSRHINKYLKEDRFPLPRIDDIFKKLQGANVFTTLDLKNAFHRYPIYPPHQHKTDFTSVDGKQYMFRGCPFGLKPISSKFQRVMSKLFSVEPFRDYVSTFFDDIVIYSKNLIDHIEHVQSVIDELTRVKLILNPQKCHFAQQTIYLLGPRKVTNSIQWPTPRTGKDIQRFLGL